jgi:hypothetical protein
MFIVIGRMSRKNAVMVVVFRTAGHVPHTSDVAGLIAKERIAGPVLDSIYATDELSR